MVVAQVVISISTYFSLCCNFIQQSILHYYDFFYDSILVFLLCAHTFFMLFMVKIKAI
jgi:hypothetical protein